MTPKSNLQLYFWAPDHLSNLHSYRPSDWKGPKLTHPASSSPAQTILRPIPPPAVSCPSQETRNHLLCTISSTAFQPPSANHLMPPYHPLRKAGHHHLSWLLPAYLTAPVLPHPPPQAEWSSWGATLVTPSLLENGACPPVPAGGSQTPHIPDKSSRSGCVPATSPILSFRCH